MLSYAEKNILVARIASGTFRCRIRGKYYVVRPPSREVRYRAQALYEETLYECRFEAWLSSKRINDILVKNELLSKDNENNIKEIEKRIEELKIELYQALFNMDKQAKIRDTLNRVRTKQEEMYGLKHMFDSATPEGFASIVRDEFILSNSIEGPVTPALMDDILSCLNGAAISISNFRELARSEPWRGYWGLGKTALFSEPVIDWTEEQRTLAMFSKLYDSVFESSEFPGDIVVNDDDMLDGWLALSKQERDKHLNDANVDKILLKGVKTDASEVFVPVKNRDQAKKIYDMNTMNAKMTIKEREAQMKQQGGVKHGDLRDQRLELQQMANEQYKDTMKGK